MPPTETIERKGENIFCSVLSMRLARRSNYVAVSVVHDRSVYKPTVKIYICQGGTQRLHRSTLVSSSSATIGGDCDTQMPVIEICNLQV